MERRGYSAEEIAKVFGGNWMRVYREAWNSWRFGVFRSSGVTHATHSVPIALSRSAKSFAKRTMRIGALRAQPGSQWRMQCSIGRMSV